ncbi:cold shock CspA family protein [Altererythrobacter ishigakiensis]|uniref:Cold shock CspA family protein n=1 Tax=Altererythrobacter ishigakiensis TaxID=476157 RepID=A0A562US65_9SPHN|nr:cold shock CspA family protein [Altererythrobacter ishigakiensis]
MKRNYGKVRTFNRRSGTGFISPSGGGELLPFRQIDVLRDSDQAIFERQRLSYEVEIDDCGEKQAIRLELQR